MSVHTWTIKVKKILENCLEISSQSVFNSIIYIRLAEYNVKFIVCMIEQI